MYKSIVDVLPLNSMIVSSLKTLALVTKPWSLLHPGWSVTPGVWRSRGEYGGGVPGSQCPTDARGGASSRRILTVAPPVASDLSLLSV